MLHIYSHITFLMFSEIFGRRENMKGFQLKNMLSKMPKTRAFNIFDNIKVIAKQTNKTLYSSTPLHIAYGFSTSKHLFVTTYLAD